MKLIEAFRHHQGTPFEIPDATREDLPPFLVEMGYKVGVEIGVYKAAYTVKFAQAGLKVFGVDPWQAYGDYRTEAKYNKLQERQDFLFGHAQRYVASYPTVTLVRKTSMAALPEFKDGSLDFVYIDGNHHFKYVAEDIWEWSKKVRKGGVIAGHDYGDFATNALDPDVYHVRYVVDAYTKALRIANWYVIGRGDKVAGERRESWRSWFWIN